MLTKEDLAERYNEPVEVICEWYARRVLPEPIKVGDQFRWRVEDIELYEDYLRARSEARENGLDPDAEDGPAPPVFSQGIPMVDTRAIKASERERQRQTKSRTLAAGSAPIGPQQHVTLPEVPSKSSKVEG